MTKEHIKLLLKIVEEEIKPRAIKDREYIEYLKKIYSGWVPNSGWLQSGET